VPPTVEVQAAVAALSKASIAVVAQRAAQASVAAPAVGALAAVELPAVGVAAAEVGAGDSLKKCRGRRVECRVEEGFSVDGSALIPDTRHMKTRSR